MGISRQQALDCFRSDDLVGIGMEADGMRRRLHPEGVAGYAICGSIDCAARTSGAADAEFAEVCSTIAASLEMGATGVRLRSLQFEADRMEALLREIRRQVRGVWIEAASAEEIRSFAADWNLSLRETIGRLGDAGLDSIASDGIDLRQDDGQARIAEWIEVHRAAHGLGMRTIAGMIFGAGETPDQRMDFLDAVRGLHEETSGFAAFAPVAAEAPGGRELDGVTAVERLKTLAIARMVLDNIENVQASGTAQALKVLQMALRFGANDAGSIAPDAGREEDIRRIIRDAGFRPAQRDMAYAAMLLS